MSQCTKCKQGVQICGGPSDKLCEEGTECVQARGGQGAELSNPANKICERCSLQKQKCEYCAQPLSST